ncbi:FAD/NAD(P)-binding protein [Algoriphagus chordae]|uniref:FAD-NAD(P)-binding protein n=1 Tax=Algoriphagus chordae TaxID=237019 RepID=A0A2W7QXI9_9BACT|nr:FAD/NAD(P)-binding protein [Algoriphagus chordae]PZX48387.1 FAD-NAD(P)-binding protein [Algoriphagus chordae]
MFKEPFKMRVGIIGLGPKGLYGLERLLANLARDNQQIPVEIHLFNKSTSFGAGYIYNCQQPSYLMMNYANGYINMWPDQEPCPIVPQPKSFVDWLKEHQAEFPKASPYTFSSRATVGRYLSEGFAELLNSCPAHITIVKHVGEVKDIRQEEDDYHISYQDSNSKTTVDDIHHILIATGHPCVNDPESQTQTNHVDFIYPVSRQLSNIPAGSSVAIKGMGLTFIDAVLALTEGRNGRFEEDINGIVTYIKSGQEPAMIYPFSQSGLPMIPRGNTYGKPAYTPYYFTKESLEFVENLEGKYHFERQLLPLIEQEFKAVYYAKLFSAKGHELSLARDFTEVEYQIDGFLEKYPETKRFDFQEFLRAPLSNIDLHKTTLDYIQRSILEAEIGVESSAFAATAELWRHLSEFFNEVYKFGGLMPQSQKTFLEEYAGHLNRISYGPPIENMKKIEAIAQAGLIDFSFAQNPNISKSAGYSLSNSKQEVIQADYMIDARIPKIQLQRCPGEFYGNLLERELILPYVNRQEGRLDYRPGCISINEKGHPQDDTGFANTAITFTGTPTEGLTYDNDTLSRKRNDFVSDWAKDITENLLSLNTESQLNPTLY